MKALVVTSALLAAAMSGVPALAQGPAAGPPAPIAPPPFAAAFAGVSLEAAEQAALANSPDVLAAHAVVEQNMAATAAVRAALGPSLVSSYAVAPQNGPAGGTITSRLTTVQVQTTVGDLVAAAPLAAAALATLRSAQSNESATKRTEELNVVNLYYAALKARAVLSARESALASANEQLRAAQTRVAKGDAPRLDVVRAQVAVARATADAELARAGDANATEALRIETGVQPAALATTTTGELPIPARDLDPATAVTRAVALRPDLAAAAHTARAAQASAHAAHRGVLPALTVGAGYAKGIDGGAPVASPVLNVSLTLPLNGAARARALQADAIVAEDKAKAASMQRSIEVAVAASARNLAAAQRASAATTQARVAAAAQLAATQVGYANGASSSLELTTARDVYTQSLVDELSAKYDEARAHAALALEVGGGP